MGFSQTKEECSRTHPLKGLSSLIILGNASLSWNHFDCTEYYCDLQLLPLWHGSLLSQGSLLGIMWCLQDYSWFPWEQRKRIWTKCKDNWVWNQWRDTKDSSHKLFITSLLKRLLAMGTNAHVCLTDLCDTKHQQRNSNRDVGSRWPRIMVDAMLEEIWIKLCLIRERGPNNKVEVLIIGDYT